MWDVVQKGKVLHFALCIYKDVYILNMDCVLDT